MSVTEKGDARDVTIDTREQVRTLEDLIRVCEIDTEVWDVVEWHANKWEVGMKLAATSRRVEGKNGTEYVAWERETNEPVVLPLYQVKARLQRKSPLIRTMQAIREALVADIRASVPTRCNVHSCHRPIIDPNITTSAQRFEDDGYLFEFAPFDLHMGKLAWDEETVTNYDIDLAEDLFNASLDYLLSRALRLTGGKIERVLCVFGNDVCHIDNKRGETTAGTRLDVDTRYIKVYRRIMQVHRRAVDILKEVAPVDIVVVPGNHDELTSFHLGEILDAVYENDPRVSVDNNAKLTKYYEFGTNLFGFTHGDSEKVSELALKMAREMPDAWSRCASREWHIGHLHISEKWEYRTKFTQDLRSDKGIRIRRLTSMSGHDAWHTKHAYMDRRACQGFVFHRTAGFTGEVSFNIDHFTGKPTSQLED